MLLAFTYHFGSVYPLCGKTGETLYCSLVVCVWEVYKRCVELSETIPVSNYFYNVFHH